MDNWNSLVVSLFCGKYETDQSYDNNCKCYRTFGNHDLVIITPTEGDNSNEILKNMFEITNNYSHQIKAGESIHNLFAVSDECESFWENEMPYLFISTIQIKFERNVSFENQFNDFKNELEKLLKNEEYVKNDNFSIYHSLDCGDILLFLKTNTYKKGSDTIYNITMNFNKKHYSYSMCAFDKELLINKVKQKDEIIPKVVVCSVIDDTSSYDEWFSKFNDEYPNEFICRNCKKDCDKRKDKIKSCPYLYEEYIHLARLGNEDICINIFNCRMHHFLNMLFDDNGIFSHKNNITKSTFSRLRIQFDTEIIVSSNIEKQTSELNYNNISLIGKYSSDWNKIKDRATPYVYKAISEIFAAIENLEIKKFAFDVQDCLINVFPLFIKKINEYLNTEEQTHFSNFEFNKNLILFITGILSIADSTLHADKLFINVPGFNAVPCDAPSKLLAYYTSFIQKLVFVLNDSEKFDYRFLLCPDLYLGIEVVKLFKYKEDDSQLLKARIPIGKLFDPKGLLMEFSHEVAHFVGTKIRCRKERACVLSKSIAYKFADMLLRPIEFDYAVDGCSINEEKQIIVSLIPELETLSFNNLLKNNFKSIPEFIKSKLDVNLNGDDEKSLYLNNVNKNLKCNSHDLFANDCMGELKEKVCENIMNDNFNIDTDDMFLLSNIMDRHIKELILCVYGKIIDDCCMLCSESFADMVMLYITKDPKLYLFKIYETEKDTAIKKNGEYLYSWDCQQSKVVKFERIISVFNALGYKFEDMKCEEDHLFNEFINVLNNYINEKENKDVQIGSIVTIEENSKYLSLCLEEIKKMNDELDDLRQLYQNTNKLYLNDYINKFRKINFDFRKEIIDKNMLT